MYNEIMFAYPHLKSAHGRLWWLGLNVLYRTYATDIIREYQ